MTSQEFSYTLKIPHDRIGVLIGTSGDIKKNIESATSTTITVDSKEGEVVITATNGVHLYDAREIIRAIARGFNPDIALQLLKTDSALEVINVTDFAGKNKNSFKRLKGRVIGSEGKAKRELERLTNCRISVYGKTIALVGQIEDVINMRRAVESLLEGATHAHVYRFLEKKRRQQRIDHMIGKKAF
jgi:ribosomal RNA assembly protein